MGIETDSQQGIEYCSVTKDVFKKYFPSLELYMAAECFTFDFEAETLSINAPVLDEFADEIYTLDNFVPLQVYDIPGLQDMFDSFAEDIGFEQFQITQSDIWKMFLQDFSEE